MKRVALCMAFTINFSLISYAQNQEKVMAIFGDSIAIGAFADTNQGTDLTFTDQSKLALAFILGFFIRPDSSNENRLRLYMSLVKPLFKAYDYSAYGGTQEWSIPNRIRKITGDSIKVYNFGKLATTQLTAWRAIANMQMERHWRHGGSADYIIYAIGSVDACIDFKPVLYNYFLRKNLRKIMRSNPDATIVLVAPADLVKVLVRPDRHAFSGFGRSVSCEEFFNITKLCHESGLKPSATMQAIEHANHMQELRLNHLRSIVNDPQKVYPGFNGQIALSDAFESRVDLDGKMAFDCFHPNIEGQRSLSNQTWSQMHHLIQR